VHEAIQEVCKNRGYKQYAINVRPSHTHAVVRAKIKPEIIADSFKAYATRSLREKGLISNDVKPWSRGRSRRYLWKPNHVDAAIDYVLYCQGGDPFEYWYNLKYDESNKYV
jgi:REP element-mobilizing transposase RayT